MHTVLNGNCKTIRVSHLVTIEHKQEQVKSNTLYLKLGNIAISVIMRTKNIPAQKKRSESINLEKIIFSSI